MAKIIEVNRDPPIKYLETLLDFLRFCISRSLDSIVFLNCTDLKESTSFQLELTNSKLDIFDSSSGTFFDNIACSANIRFAFLSCIGVIVTTVSFNIG